MLQDKYILSIRPGARFPGLIELIEKEARENNRSMNNWVCQLISDYFKNKISNEETAKLSIESESNSKAT